MLFGQIQHAPPPQKMCPYAYASHDGAQHDGKSARKLRYPTGVLSYDLRSYFQPMLIYWHNKKQFIVICIRRQNIVIKPCFWRAKKIAYCNIAKKRVHFVRSFWSFTFFCCNMTDVAMTMNLYL